MPRRFADWVEEYEGRPVLRLDEIGEWIPMPKEDAPAGKLARPFETPAYVLKCVEKRSCPNFNKPIDVPTVPTKPVLCRKCGFGMYIFLKRDKKAA